MTARWSLVLCMAFAAPVLGTPAVAVAGPAESEQMSIRVVVEAKLGDAGPAFEDVIAVDLRAAIEEAGYELDDSVRADATVRLRISYFNDVNLDYQIDVDIAAGPELVQLETLPCPQCADNALLGKIGEHLPTILDKLEQTLAKATNEEPQPANDDEVPAVEQDPEPRAKRPMGVLGGVGIGVAALGVGALIAGGVEFGRGQVHDDVPRTATELTGVDHRPVGGALLGVGGAVLVAGVTMLVVDLVRSKKNPRGDAGLAHPLLGPDFVGLGYSKRF